MQPQSRKSQFALHIKPNPEGSDSGVKWGKRAISKVERPQHLKASKIVIYVLLFVVVFLFIALALDLLYSLTNSVSLSFSVSLAVLKMNSLARGPRPCVSTLCRCLQISTVRQRQQPFQVPIEAARKYNKDNKNNSNKQQICNTGCTTETATLKSTFLGTIGSTLGPHSAAARSFASAWSQ